MIWLLPKQITTGDTLMTVKSMEDWMLTMEHKLIRANNNLDKLQSKEKELRLDNSRVHPAHLKLMCCAWQIVSCLRRSRNNCCVGDVNVAGKALPAAETEDLSPTCSFNAR